MNTETTNAPSTTMTATPTSTANDPLANTEHQSREAEYLTLRELAAKAERLDRQIQRERSYAALRYAR